MTWNHRPHARLPGRLHGWGFSEGWTADRHSAAWTFRVKQPGTYRVTAATRYHRGRLELYNTPALTVTVGDQQGTGTVDTDRLDQSEGTRAYPAIETDLGTVTFASCGDHTVTLTATGFEPETERGVMCNGLVFTREG